MATTSARLDAVISSVLEEAVSASYVKRQQAAAKLGKAAIQGEHGWVVGLEEARSAATIASWSKDELSALLTAAVHLTMKLHEGEEQARVITSPPEGPQPSPTPEPLPLSLAPPPVPQSMTPIKARRTSTASKTPSSDDLSHLPIHTLSHLGSIPPRTPPRGPKPTLHILKSLPTPLLTKFSASVFPPLEHGVLARDWGCLECKGVHRVLASSAEMVFSVIENVLVAQVSRSETFSDGGALDCYFHGCLEAMRSSGMRKMSRGGLKGVGAAALQGLICCVSAEVVDRCKYCESTPILSPLSPDSSMSSSFHPLLKSDLVGDAVRETLDFHSLLQAAALRWCQSDVWWPSSFPFPTPSPPNARQPLFSNNASLNQALHRLLKRWARLVAWSWGRGEEVVDGGDDGGGEVERCEDVKLGVGVSCGWVKQWDRWESEPMCVFGIPPHHPRATHLMARASPASWQSPCTMMDETQFDSSFDPIFAVLIARLGLLWAKTTRSTPYFLPRGTEATTLTEASTTSIVVPLLPPLLLSHTSTDGREEVFVVGGVPWTCISRHGD